MVVPHDIGPTDPLDPLLLPSALGKLPSTDPRALDTILAALESHLDPSSSTQDATIEPTLLTAQMRLITRNAYASLNAARTKAAKARQVLDKQDTVLRGVEYERARIREEIELCDEYKPAYTAIELQEPETFVQEASEEVRQALPAADEEGYEYAIIIAQLEQELAEIQEREGIAAQLTKDRDSLIRAKKDVKHKFDSFDSHLKAFESSSIKISERLTESTHSEPRLSAAATEIAAEAAARAHDDRVQDSQPDTPNAIPRTAEVDALTPREEAAFEAEGEEAGETAEGTTPAAPTGEDEEMA